MKMTAIFRSVSAIMILVFFVFTASNGRTAESADKQKRDLLIKRLELQKKIVGTMDLYESFSKESVTFAKELKKKLGNTSYSEATELFQSGQMPSDMRPAFTIWKQILEHEKKRWWLRIWLDRREEEDLIGEFDRKIKNVDDMIRIGAVLTEDDLQEVFRLLASEINSPSVTKIPPADEIECAKKASEWLEKAMSSNKKGGTE